MEGPVMYEDLDGLNAAERRWIDKQCVLAERRAACLLAVLRRGVLQLLERSEHALEGAAVDHEHGRVDGGSDCRRALVC